MKLTQDEIVKFASELAKFAEAGDFDNLCKYYSPEARLWVNTSQTWSSLDEHLASAMEVRKQLRGLRYLDMRIQPFENGYVQQCRTLADLADGRRFDLPVCIIFRLRDGKIIEREEYVDSAGVTMESSE